MSRSIPLSRGRGGHRSVGAGGEGPVPARQRIADFTRPRLRHPRGSSQRKLKPQSLDDGNLGSSCVPLSLNF